MGCVDKTVVVLEALQLSSVDMAVTSVSRCVVVVVLGAVALQRAFWDIAEAVANDSSGAGSALELLVARAMAERDRFVAQFSPHPRAPSK